MNSVLRRFLHSIKYFPYHFILFLLFFVLDGLTFFKPLISISSSLNLFAILLIVSILIFAIFTKITKNVQKSGLIVLSTEIGYLYFGVIYDNIKQILKEHISYTIFVPPFLTIAIYTLYKLFKRKSSFYRSTFCANCVCLFLLGYQLVLFLQTVPEKNFVLSNYSISYKESNKLTEPHKPDIFFIVFDAYLNTSGLKERFQYDNSDLDTFLTKKGFYVFGNTISDYRYTQYSIASVFNMSLLDTAGIQSEENFNKAYATYIQLINKNPVLDVLQKEGYTIFNLSPFKIADISPMFYQPLQPSNQNLLMEKSFFNKIRQDITLEGFIKKYNLFFLYKFIEHPIKKYNDASLVELKGITSKHSTHPKFVYVHVLMPHAPYFYDSLGNNVNPKNFLADENYLGYSVYCKEKIKEIVTNIQTNPNTVIMLISDHGPHIDPKGIPNINRKNLFSIYLPNEQYSGLNDSLSIYNSFKILFDDYFPNLKFSLKSSHPITTSPFSMSLKK